MDVCAMAAERELCERDCEPQSLEYMEDPYFIQLDGDATPSFDLDEDYEFDTAPTPWGDPADVERDLDSFSLEPYVETEFIVNNRRRRLRIFRKKMRDVRVTFQDLSKPYLARVSSHSNYKKFLGITPQAEDAISAGLASPAGDGTPPTPPSELAGLSPEEQERLKAEWSRELARVEDEIATLRTVLQSKIRQSSDLKRKLGITVWKEITEDVNQGLKNVKESQVYQSVETHVGQISKAVTDAPLYQKTESVIKSTAEKTTSILGGITTKLGQMRNSESFRSIEERVGTAYENVKGKVASRSNSTQSFDEALREANRSASGATSPTIPENKAFP